MAGNTREYILCRGTRAPQETSRLNFFFSPRTKGAEHLRYVRASTPGKASSGQADVAAARRRGGGGRGRRADARRTAAGCVRALDRLQRVRAPAVRAAPPSTDSNVCCSCGGLDPAMWGMCAANTARELDESPENWVGGFEQGP